MKSQLAAFFLALFFGPFGLAYIGAIWSAGYLLSMALMVAALSGDGSEFFRYNGVGPQILMLVHSAWAFAAAEIARRLNSKRVPSAKSQPGAA